MCSERYISIACCHFKHRSILWLHFLYYVSFVGLRSQIQNIRSVGRVRFHLCSVHRIHFQQNAYVCFFGAVLMVTAANIQQTYGITQFGLQLCVASVFKKLTATKEVGQKRKFQVENDVSYVPKRTINVCIDVRHVFSGGEKYFGNSKSRRKHTPNALMETSCISAVN